MKNNDLVLTLDFGTQSVRAIIFDDQGTPLAMEKYSYKPAYFSLKPGYAEQDPDFYWDHMCEVTKNLVNNNPDLIKRVKAASLTCFRDTAVILDENKKPLRPAILWCDQRNARCEKRLPFLKSIIYFIAGMTETVQLNRKRTMANWIQENEPDTWKKVKHYWALSTYLSYRLTGQEVDTAANYTGHYPIDMKKGKWYKKSNLKYDIFNIDPILLPKLIQVGTVIGKISKEYAQATGLSEDIVVVANGTDKGSETIGTGCLTRDYASLSYGTASTVEVSNPKYIEPETFLPAYQASIPNLYNMEIQIYRGYWMVTWFKENFGTKESLEAEIQKLAVEEVLNKDLLKIAPGSEGLVLQPYWGPMLKRPLAKGTIVGFSDHHTRAHVYKAVIEGIAYGLKDGLETIEKRQHHKVKQLMVSGGGSQSDAICQITADIFGLPVSRVQTFETGSLGTAVVAFTGINHFANAEEAVQQMVHLTKTFTPNMENHDKYEFLFRKVYLQLYPRLTKLNKNLVKYNRKYVRNEIL